MECDGPLIDIRRIALLLVSKWCLLAAVANELVGKVFFFFFLFCFVFFFLKKKNEKKN
jgi:hypothetical protein